MKKNITVLCASMALLFMLISCEEKYVTYDGPNYIMFSDTMYIFPVQNNVDYYEIPVSATQVCDYDRTLAVEILDAGSNAVEGRDYELESNTVTIKAGEYATNVRIRGFHDKIGVYDSLGVHLRLLAPEKTKWSLYGNEAKVVLQKACPFDINVFTGYCVVNSTYIYNYITTTDVLLRKSKVDPENENTIIIEDYFYNGYDVRIKFNTKDILEPLIEFEAQGMGLTSDAFGTIYGDGEIWMSQPSAYTSYFSSCEKFILQYMTVYVPGMAAGTNTVGVFVNAVEWISDDEAEKMKREGY
ncbi:MAG: DUF4984 domain-containing protein [Bacteroidaceae bacterium]|nr:DUF4984 domain-containing protein [Bacteroidaceae bacterium]